MSTAVTTVRALTADGAAYTTVVVTIYDEFLDPLPDENVTLASNRTGGKDVISRPWALTSAAGVASFNVSSVYAGAAKFTASVIE